MRDPAILLVALGALVMTVFAPAYNLFHFGEVEKVVAEMTLSTALLTGMVTAILGSIRAMAFELEDRTALVLLGKPLRRTILVVGKYLGVVVALVTCTVPVVAGALCITRIVQLDEEAWALGASIVVGGVRLAPGAIPLYAGLATGFVAGAVWFWRARWARAGGALVAMTLCGLGGAVASSRFGEWRWSLMPAGALVILETGVVAAICTAAAVRLKAAGTALTGVLVVAVGHVRELAAPGSLLAPGGGPPVALVPGLEAFNAVAAAAAGAPVSWMYVAWAGVYATIYVCSALLVGSALLQSREVR